MAAPAADCFSGAVFWLETVSFVHKKLQPLEICTRTSEARSSHVSRLDSPRHLPAPQMIHSDDTLVRTSLNAF